MITSISGTGAQLMPTSPQTSSAGQTTSLAGGKPSSGAESGLDGGPGGRVGDSGGGREASPATGSVDAAAVDILTALLEELEELELAEEEYQAQLQAGLETAGVDTSQSIVDLKL